MKNLKIAIPFFEEFHYEVLFSVVQLFSHINTKISIYTTENLEERVKSQFQGSIYDSELEYYSYPVSKKNDFAVFFSYLRIAKRVLKNKPDTVISISSEYNPLFYAGYYFFPKKIKYIPLIHNLNYVLTERNRGRLLTHLRLFCLNHTDCYAVCLETLKDYIEKNKLTDKNIYIFPRFYDERFFVQQSEIHTALKTVYTITGAVEEKRRDYISFFSALKLLDKKALSQMKLILLGKLPDTAYGRKIKEQCDIFIEKGLSVTYFTYKVPMTEFEDYLKMTDYMISPIKSDTIFKGMHEIYGSTKVSGNIMDAIQYALPVIMPFDQCIPEKLQSSILQYIDEKGLADCITSTIGVYSYKEKAEENSRKYSIENYYAQFNK